MSTKTNKMKTNQSALSREWSFHLINTIFLFKNVFSVQYLFLLVSNKRIKRTVYNANIYTFQAQPIKLTIRKLHFTPNMFVVDLSIVHLHCIKNGWVNLTYFSCQHEIWISKHFLQNIYTAAIPNAMRLFLVNFSQ